MGFENSGGGIGVISATLLVAGGMAGSGVLALPRALVDSGWIGLVLIILFCINSAYGGTRLGKSWDILEERYPEYKGSTRDPYPAIAEKAMGKYGRYLVTVCNSVCLFGVGTVFIILASQIFEELLSDIAPKITFCLWLLIIGALLTPLSWLGSPKDFWFVGLGAISTTSASCLAIFIQMMMEGTDSNAIAPVYEQHGAKEFFVSFGVILFAFGGASTFPTIQNDMADRKKFSLSVTIGYIILLIIYLPVAIGGFLVYGESVQDNIILSLKKSPLVTTANCFMALHLTMAFLIITNPISQEIEGFLNIQPKFNAKRCLVRSGMVCLMVFVAESVPQFGVILALLGGTTVAISAFILPQICYMLLCNQETKDFPKRHIAWYYRTYMWLLVAIGVLGGAASTYSALESMFNSHFRKPCYWP
uniref:Vesicular inhibitory amino acid transporter, putative n=1 Tax=Riptortus pedestris TaxID=329032 RepID=R4WS75_RIPPE|nr:vesicular inhibitory amino acid transporter, putative [Riptortus pedestris]